MKTLLTVLFTLTLAVPVALANDGNSKQQLRMCTIKGSDYVLLQSLEVSPGGVSSRLFQRREFTGTMTLLRGVVPLATFSGSGKEIYTGKHTGYSFQGQDSTGRSFRLQSPYGYEFLPFVLDADVKGGLHLEFDWFDLDCKNI